MAKSSARSMAFDEAGDPFVLIRQGKRLSICSLMGDKLTRIRDVPLRFWWFRVATVEGERFALLREDVRCRGGAGCDVFSGSSGKYKNAEDF